MNDVKKWWLKREREHISQLLDRLERLTYEIEKTESGSGIINKIKRLHTLPVMKSERKDLMERRDGLQSKLDDVIYKLRDLE